MHVNSRGEGPGSANNRSNVPEKEAREKQEDMRKLTCAGDGPRAVAAADTANATAGNGRNTHRRRRPSGPPSNSQRLSGPVAAIERAAAGSRRRTRRGSTCLHGVSARAGVAAGCPRPREIVAGPAIGIRERNSVQPSTLGYRSRAISDLCARWFALFKLQVDRQTHFSKIF